MSTTHAFADHIGLRIVESRPGHSVCTVTIAAHHLNPHGVVHGAVLFALADTGMGAAVYPHLRPDQSCTTISAQIGYLAAARAGELRCETSVVRLGRTVAHLESRVLCDGIRWPPRAGSTRSRRARRLERLALPAGVAAQACSSGAARRSIIST